MLNGYTEFANAIIIQAVKDYRRASTPQMRREIKRFFLASYRGGFYDNGIYSSYESRDCV